MHQLTRRFDRRLVVPMLAALLLPAIFRSALRAEKDARLVPTGASFIQPTAVLTYVTNPAVRDDLKLRRTSRSGSASWSSSVRNTTPASFIRRPAD